MLEARVVPVLVVGAGAVPVPGLDWIELVGGIWLWPALLIWVEEPAGMLPSVNVGLSTSD